MFSKLLNFLPFLVVITLLLAVVFLVQQQNLRTGANDPQFQIAEDIQNSLDKGEDPTKVVTGSIDPSKSLSPFVVVYNENKDPIASSVSLDGKIPPLPKGVFDYVEQNKQDRITWQPRDDVRLAAVVLKYSKGFVLSARSLSEVESRENTLGKMMGAAYVGTVIVSFIAFLFASRFKK